MLVSRRSVLKAGAAGGALLVASPAAGVGRGRRRTLLEDPARRSRISPGGPVRLVHADLHNHTLLSDGDGDAAAAFASMRTHGLDVAALTDHAGAGKLQGGTCAGCAAAVGIDESEWARIGELADAADERGQFTAVRGFEWSSPTLGHMNVWFTSTWTDPAATGGIGAGSTVAFMQHEGGSPFGPEVTAAADTVLRALPDGAVSMTGFYDWLAASPTRAGLGGGLDGIAGFNHPGREGGRFGFFSYEPRIADRVVSLEMFNRGEDYVYEQADVGGISPLVDCLDAGWRVGLLGVTDEHGTNWGEPDGKGRTGIWVPELSREGVRAGMQSRRFFATRERDVRLDAAAAGVPMGGDVRHTSGELDLALDLFAPHLVGRELLLQVLQTGRPMPTVVDTRRFVVPTADVVEPLTFRVPVDRADGDWFVVRVTDPSQPADKRADDFADYRSAGRAVAYASPWWLRGA